MTEKELNRVMVAKNIVREREKNIEKIEEGLAEKRFNHFRVTNDNGISLDIGSGTDILIALKAIYSKEIEANKNILDEFGIELEKKDERENKKWNSLLKKKQPLSKNP